MRGRTVRDPRASLYRDGGGIKALGSKGVYIAPIEKPIERKRRPLPTFGTASEADVQLDAILLPELQYTTPITIVQSPTGSGKTEEIARLASKHKVQAITHLKATRDTINSRAVEGTCRTLKSFCSSKQDFNGLDFLIIDELAFYLEALRGGFYTPFERLKLYSTLERAVREGVKLVVFDSFVSKASKEFLSKAGETRMIVNSPNYLGLQKIDVLKTDTEFLNRMLDHAEAGKSLSVWCGSKQDAECLTELLKEATEREVVCFTADTMRDDRTRSRLEGLLSEPESIGDVISVYNSVIGRGVSFDEEIDVVMGYCSNPELLPTEHFQGIRRHRRAKSIEVFIPSNPVTYKSERHRVEMSCLAHAEKLFDKSDEKGFTDLVRMCMDLKDEEDYARDHAEEMWEYLAAKEGFELSSEACQGEYKLTSKGNRILTEGKRAIRAIRAEKDLKHMIDAEIVSGVKLKELLDTDERDLSSEERGAKEKALLLKRVGGSQNLETALTLKQSQRASLALIDGLERRVGAEQEADYCETSVSDDLYFEGLLLLLKRMRGDVSMEDLVNRRLLACRIGSIPAEEKQKWVEAVISLKDEMMELCKLDVGRHETEIGNGRGFRMVTKLFSQIGVVWKVAGKRRAYSVDTRKLQMCYDILRARQSYSLSTENSSFASTSLLRISRDPIREQRAKNSNFTFKLLFSVIRSFKNDKKEETE